MYKTIAALLAAAALTACSGGQQSSSSSTTTTAASPAATVAAMKPAKPMKAVAANGSALYSQNCSSCHQTNGKGMPGAFPPLAGNAVVTGPAANVIHIVKNGLQGKIMVGNASFNGTMPPWKALKPEQIAAILTYVRSSWGNHASAITAAQVAATK